MNRTMSIYFAPMEGITGYPFRNAHRKFFSGVERYYSPFLVTNQHFSFKKKEMRDVNPENNRQIHLIPQVLSNNAEQFVHAAGMLGGLGYKEINYNLGCPSPTVVSRHRGAGMLKDTDSLDRFLDHVFSGLEKTKDAPAISVKTRVGMSDVEEADELVRIYNRYPFAEVIVHARLREDYYKGPIRMDSFRTFYEECRHPLVFNGDLKKVSDIEITRQQFPNLKAVMIGRGLIENPALAREYAKSGAQLNREELWNFLEVLFLNYRVEMADDQQVMYKMKELWSYLKVQFPGSEKQMKHLRKAKHPEEYRAFLEEIFST